MDQVTPPTIDEAKLDEFGKRLFSTFETYKKDRKAAEERWMKNLRQFRGIYDPELLKMISADGSKAYPKLTRWKVIAAVARLMQMLFPQTEKNFTLKPGPVPNLPTATLQALLDEISAANQTGQPLTNDQIEQAIKNRAEALAANMEKKVSDDLAEMDYVTLARRVVMSAAIYNVGVLKGPFHEEYKERNWRLRQDGKYVAEEVTKYKPRMEFTRLWGWYPDMTAESIDKQDGAFERHVMTRAQVEALASRKDFLKDRVLKWLNDHASGNYSAEWWESELESEKKSDRQNTSEKQSRKYVVVSYVGAVSGHDLRAAGVTIKDEDLGRTFNSSVWMIDNTVIKCRLFPLENTQHYHVFVFEEDDLSLLGNGLPDVLRDSQLSLAEATRGALDNMSVVGPMAEVNIDLLAPGETTEIRKHKTWRREGEGNAASQPAVRAFSVESHLAELTALMKVFMEFADLESGQPPQSVGDLSQGGTEALRTQGNASMFLGAAALPIRDTVRNFDTFTVSVMTALVKWNEKYDPNPLRDGDSEVIARGSTSMIQKETLAQSLDVFRSTLAPDELPHLKTRELLKIRARARDIPIEDILEDEATAKANIERIQGAQVQQAQDQAALVQAQTRDFLAASMKKIAEAQAAEANISVDTFLAIIEALASGDKQAAKAGAGNSNSSA